MHFRYALHCSSSVVLLMSLPISGNDSVTDSTCAAKSSDVEVTATDKDSSSSSSFSTVSAASARCAVADDEPQH